MNEKRHPNTKCFECHKPIYRRPFQIKRGPVFCSTTCSNIRKRNEHPCVVCGKPILGSRNAKTCSRECSNKNRTGTKYTKGQKHTNASERRLAILLEKYPTTTCMIEGCTYSATLDVHRFISGKQGGKYELGNMFAICPNHHAEITRKLIVVEKVNDFCLRIVRHVVTVTRFEND